MIAAKQQQRETTDRQAKRCYSSQALNQREFQVFGARAMPEHRKNCEHPNRAALLLLKK